MTAALLAQPTGFPAYRGPLDSAFGLGESELLRDLYAVIEAVGLKPVRLTKSGIPPKPLWTAINQRLLWKDPPGVLHDWEEADQVRFTYLMAVGLDLIRPDDELWLGIGPGADQLFLAGPLERAHMVRRAYLHVWDWDERCDARNEHGNRHNFGQTFRRDFVHDVDELRGRCLDLLSRLPGREWVGTGALALALSQEQPDLLLSEVCSLPETDSQGLDPEKVRFVDFWLALLCRFGWVELGRSGGPGPSRRLCRLSPLGAALFRGAPPPEETEPAVAIEAGPTLVLPGDPVSVPARYLAKRLGEPPEGTRRGQPLRFRLTRESLARAADTGCDLEAAWSWLYAHAEGAPPAAFSEAFQAVLAGRRRVRIVQNATAIELPAGHAELHERLSRGGAIISGRLALGAGEQLTSLLEGVGGEPSEAFDYPPDEALGALRAAGAPALHLFYGELPVLHRDLLDALGPEGDPPAVVLTADKVPTLKQRGYTPASVGAALEAFTGKPLPAKLAKQIEEMWGT